MRQTVTQRFNRAFQLETHFDTATEEFGPTREARSKFINPRRDPRPS